MRAILTSAEAGALIQGFQRNRAFLFCYPQYALPDRGDPTIYRVQALGARLVRRGSAYQLIPAAWEHELT